MKILLVNILSIALNPDITRQGNFMGRISGKIFGSVVDKYILVTLCQTSLKSPRWPDVQLFAARPLKLLHQRDGPWPGSLTLPFLTYHAQYITTFSYFRLLSVP